MGAPVGAFLPNSRHVVEHVADERGNHPRVRKIEGAHNLVPVLVNTPEGCLKLLGRKGVTQRDFDFDRLLDGQRLKSCRACSFCRACRRGCGEYAYASDKSFGVPLPWKCEPDSL